MQHIYIVFSSTPNKMGGMIRKLTGTAYNHVSVALDAELTHMYGFARRNYHYPLYGGFVRESVARYHINGKRANIKICKIPVDPPKYCRLKSLLTEMEQEQEKYLYNYLSILGMPFKRWVPVRNAYICIEFAVKVLQKVGFKLSLSQYYRIPDLEQYLADYVMYTGVIGQGPADQNYFDKGQISHPCLATIKGFAALFPRLSFKQNAL